MSERNPFRVRKSVSKHGRGKNKRRVEADKRSADALALPLPSPQNARQLAVAVLDEYKRTKTFLGELFDRFLPVENESTASSQLTLTDQDRRFAFEMATGIVRRETTLDCVLTAFVARPKHQVEPRLWTLMQLGAYQLLMMDRVPPHAAVGETVQLTKWMQEAAWTGFLNGVLRSIARDLQADDSTESNTAASESDAANESNVVADKHSKRSLALPRGKFRIMKRDIFSDPRTQTHRYISESYGFPLWLIARWAKRFSTEQLFTMCDWFNNYGKMFLRVNQTRTTRDEILALFENSPNIAADEFGASDLPECIWYDGSVKPIAIPGFQDGLITIQDETAMRAARLLAPESGWAVLDMCAAPGTKSTHLAELMNDTGRVVAADSSARRLPQISQNCERLGLTCIEALELNEDSSNLPNEEFDAALVDVPCSNTGVLGKRPEVRSRLQMGEFAELAVLQLRILKAAANAVKPNGRLVYSTCSIESEENAGVVNAFLEPKTWELISQVEHIPGQPTDGGFHALFRKL
jgi:16S rRNA (cytosine967-C5)-methyltransferase